MNKVDLVDATLIKEAIDRLKSSKSDCLYNFGSDAFIKAKEVIAEPIAFLLKSFLIHGFVPLFLLVCSLVPLVKDKLGDISSSDNYRAIAISSLLLKIFDWVLILLFSDKLKTCDLQFDFQEKSSRVNFAKWDSSVNGTLFMFFASCAHKDEKIPFLK